MNTAKRVLGAVAWLALAVIVALGGAGIVAAMNHVPGTASRSELTWQADQAATAKLDDATNRLDALTTAVDTLGSTAREAFAAVVAGDADKVQSTIATGTAQLAAVTTARDDLGAALAAVPDVGPDSALRIGPEVQDRYDGIAGTLDLTGTIRDDWAGFTGRALDAMHLNAMLARHDQETAGAAQRGAQADYPGALTQLDTSDATIAEMRQVRDRLANTVDVAVLTQWIDRNAAYDGALRTLYEVLAGADGAVTKKVRAAFDAEQAARARLPADTRPLVVIMADLAQGGLNQAAISIEEAHAALADALQIQRQIQQDVKVALPDS